MNTDLSVRFFWFKIKICTALVPHLNHLRWTWRQLLVGLPSLSSLCAFFSLFIFFLWMASSGWVTCEMRNVSLKLLHVIYLCQIDLRLYSVKIHYIFLPLKFLFQFHWEPKIIELICREKEWKNILELILWRIRIVMTSWILIIGFICLLNCLRNCCPFQKKKKKDRFEGGFTKLFSCIPEFLMTESCKKISRLVLMPLELS